MESYNENQTYLSNTLNVKLRYEQIIKNMISNENTGSQKSVLEIIATTKAAKTVTLDNSTAGSMKYRTKQKGKDKVPVNLLSPSKTK